MVPVEEGSCMGWITALLWSSRGGLTIATALLINEQFLEPKLLGERAGLGGCAR